MSAYAPGDVIANRYRIVGPLSKGAMGAIHRAEHVYSGQEVALKVLLDQYLSRDDLVERFEREAQAVGDLKHPHIVAYQDHGTDDEGRPFLVTELIDGYPGFKLVRRVPPLSLGAIVHVVRQLCSALSIAHDRGIIHRDLKWSNVMITPQDDDPLFVKLIDFGIIRFADHVAPQRKLTRAGVLLGTPEYTAPEQILGRPLDGRADQYALGVMTYELVAGRRPFVDENKAVLLTMHVKEPPPSLIASGYNVPPAFDAAVLRALSKNPEDRFASVLYFSRALEAAVKEQAGVEAGADGDGGWRGWLKRISGRE